MQLAVNFPVVRNKFYFVFFCHVTHEIDYEIIKIQFRPKKKFSPKTSFTVNKTKQLSWTQRWKQILQNHLTFKVISISLFFVDYIWYVCLFGLMSTWIKNWSSQLCRSYINTRDISICFDYNEQFNFFLLGWCARRFKQSIKCNYSISS